MKFSTIYFSLMLLAGLIAVTVPNGKLLTSGETYGKSRKRYRFQIYSINILVILFSAFRQISNATIDEYAYRNRFVSYSFLGLHTVLKNTSEYLFESLVWISTRLFSTSQGVIIVTGTLTVIFFLLSIKLFSKDYALAIILFFSTGLLWSTFNGIQQFLASALFAACSVFLYRRDLKKFLVTVFICTMIHSASVFLLFFYLLATMKPGNWKMYAWDLLFLIGGALIYRLVPFLAQSAGIEFFDPYVNAVTEGHHGVKTITVLIHLVPALLALYYSLKTKLEEDRVTDVAANITILDGLIYCLSTMDVYIARLAMFTWPFTIIFLSRVSPYVKNKTLVKTGMIVAYSIVTFLLVKNATYTFNFAF